MFCCKNDFCSKVLKQIFNQLDLKRRRNDKWSSKNLFWEWEKKRVDNYILTTWLTLDLRPQRSKGQRVQGYILSELVSDKEQGRALSGSCNRIYLCTRSRFVNLPISTDKLHVLLHLYISPATTSKAVWTSRPFSLSFSSYLPLNWLSVFFLYSK